MDWFLYDSDLRHERVKSVELWLDVVCLMNVELVVTVKLTMEGQLVCNNLCFLKWVLL